MPSGDKSSYTGKQKRQARHIEEGYEKRGVRKKEARTTRLGNRERRNPWGQEIRLGPWQESEPCAVAQGWPARRQGRGPAACGRTFTFGQEGCSDTQAPRVLTFRTAGRRTPPTRACC
jgi:hypothetical protein